MIQIYMMATGGTLGVVIIIFIPRYLETGSHSFMLVNIVAMIFAVLGAMTIAVMRWGEVLHSISISLDAPTSETIPRLEEGLRAQGIPFTRRGTDPDTGRSAIKARFDEVLDLRDGEQRIAIMTSMEASVVFLGPVNRENAEETEQLKGLIVAAGIG